MIGFPKVTWGVKIFDNQIAEVELGESLSKIAECLWNDASLSELLWEKKETLGKYKYKYRTKDLIFPGMRISLKETPPTTLCARAKVIRTKKVEKKSKTPLLMPIKPVETKQMISESVSKIIIPLGDILLALQAIQISIHNLGQESWLSQKNIISLVLATASTVIGGLLMGETFGKGKWRNLVLSIKKFFVLPLLVQSDLNEGFLPSIYFYSYIWCVLFSTKLYRTCPSPNRNE